MEVGKIGKQRRSHRPVRRGALEVALIAALALVVAGVFGDAADAAPKWPYKTLQIGLVDPEHNAAALRSSAPFAMRYQYLSGGVNTGHDWVSWDIGHGAFVTNYVLESAASGFIPVFSYYEMAQSLPGDGSDYKADMVNLGNRATMRAYLQNLRLLLQLLGVSGKTVVLHLEPDMWGYVEQRVGDDASNKHAEVASTGLPELRGLPNNVSGLARAIVRLRDRYAPKVLLGYSLSVFGTGKDLHYSDLTHAQTDAIARRAVKFYRSLHARFDAVFAEYTNTDAGYSQVVLRIVNAFWGASDYARQVRFLGDFHRAVHLPIVLWQIPVGNTLYRAMDNTYGHYQDNRVQWLLGTNSRAHLRAYIRAGVVALLFGGGLPGSTCACDAMHDGVTNPPPISGNIRRSRSADDDGGYLKWRTRVYYSGTPLKLG